MQRYDVESMDLELTGLKSVFAANSPIRLKRATCSTPRGLIALDKETYSIEEDPWKLSLMGQLDFEFTALFLKDTSSYPTE